MRSLQQVGSRRKKAASFSLGPPESVYRSELYWELLRRGPPAHGGERMGVESVLDLLDPSTPEADDGARLEGLWSMPADRGSVDLGVDEVGVGTAG